MIKSFKTDLFKIDIAYPEGSCYPKVTCNINTLDVSVSSQVLYEQAIHDYNMTEKINTQFEVSRTQHFSTEAAASQENSCKVLLPKG